MLSRAAATLLLVAPLLIAAKPEAEARPPDSPAASDAREPQPEAARRRPVPVKAGEVPLIGGGQHAESETERRNRVACEKHPEDCALPGPK